MCFPQLAESTVSGPLEFISMGRILDDERTNSTRYFSLNSGHERMTWKRAEAGLHHGAGIEYRRQPALGSRQCAADVGSKSPFAIQRADAALARGLMHQPITVKR